MTDLQERAVRLIRESKAHTPEPGYECDVDMIQRLAAALEETAANLADRDARIAAAHAVLLSAFPGQKLVPGCRVGPHEHAAASEHARRILSVPAVPVPQDGADDALTFTKHQPPVPQDNPDPNVYQSFGTPQDNPEATREAILTALAKTESEGGAGLRYFPSGDPSPGAERVADVMLAAFDVRPKNGEKP